MQCYLLLLLSISTLKIEIIKKLLFVMLREREHMKAVGIFVFIFLVKLLENDSTHLSIVSITQGRICKRLI